MDAAPQIVQNAVASPMTQQMIEQIGKQYSLHIDVVGLLVKLTNYMLLGYIRPEDSFQELYAAKISEQQARQIIEDINQKIFVPLREEMRRGGGGASIVGSAKPLAQSTPMSSKINAPSTEQKSHFNLQNKINPPVRQIHSDIRPPASQNNPPQKNVPPRPVSIGNARPVLETQQPHKSNTLLEDREEPSPSLTTVERKEVPIPTPPPRISFNTVPTPTVAPTVSGNSSPLREALSKVLPGSNVPAPQKVAAPQSFVVRTTAAELMPNLPGAVSSPASPEPISPKETLIPPRILPQEKSQPKPISSPLKSYSSDPYREPIE